MLRERAGMALGASGRDDGGNSGGNLTNTLPHLEDDATRPVARSLFDKILDQILAPLLLSWPISIAVAYLVAGSIANASHSRTLESSTITLGQQLREVNNHVTLQLPILAREVLRAGETDNIYQVLNTDGEFVSRDRDLPLPPEEDANAGGLMQLRDGHIHSAEIRVTYTFVQRPGFGGKPAPVQVVETLGKHTQLASEIIRGVILPQFMILPSAMILVWFGLTCRLAPLNMVRECIHVHSPDDTNPIGEDTAPQGLTPLAALSNDLLGRLEQSVHAQRRFIAGATHQMGTLLTSLCIQAKLAQREQSLDKLRHTLAHIAGNSDRAAHLVRQLLLLVRVENMGTTDGMVPLDICALSRRVVADWLPKAWAKQIDLGLEESGPPIMVSSSTTILAKMLNNLLDSAIRYTPDGEHVTVRVTAAPFEPFISIDVDDTDPGIPVAEREHVMRYFYRILDTQTEGNRLGLAIVREVVQQHDGDIEMLDNVYQTSPRLTGAHFRITLHHASAGGEVSA